MHDEIARHGAVHRLLRLGAPRLFGGRVIGEYPDDVELSGIAKGRAADAFEFAAENKMQELFGLEKFKKILDFYAKQLQCQHQTMVLLMFLLEVVF